MGVALSQSRRTDQMHVDGQSQVHGARQKLPARERARALREIEARRKLDQLEYPSVRNVFMPRGGGGEWGGEWGGSGVSGVGVG